MISVDVREHSRWRSPALQRIDPLVQEADIAGNAIDGAAPTLDDLVHEIWLAHEGARHRQEVGIARAQDFLHHLRRSHAADEDHRDIDRRLRRAGERPIIGFGHRSRKTAVQHAVGNRLRTGG